MEMRLILFVCLAGSFLHSVGAKKPRGWISFFFRKKSPDSPIPLQSIIEKKQQLVLELQWCCLMHYNQKIETLLNDGASTEKKEGYEEQTALHIACNGKNKQAISLLLKHKADIEAEDKYGNTPLIYAIRRKLNVDIIAQLMNKTTVTSKALGEALNRNSPKVVKLLLNSGAKLPPGEKLPLSPFRLHSKENMNNYEEILRLMHEAFPEKYDPPAENAYS
jgi:hypothetical protein